MFSEPIVYEAEILDSRYKKKGFTMSYLLIKTFLWFLAG